MATSERLLLGHEFNPHDEREARNYCHHCGQPRAAHRTAQTPTADATASARLTAEADADGTGSRVGPTTTTARIVPCNRCHEPLGDQRHWFDGFPYHAACVSAPQPSTEPERVCARCDDCRRDVDRLRQAHADWPCRGSGCDYCALLVSISARIARRCLAAHHAREDAALVAEIQAKHHLYRGYTGDARKECGHGCGLWPCDAARLAARLEGGKR